MATKVFITVFIIEGNSDVPDPSDKLNFSESAKNYDKVGEGNVYKRIAEYCLDIRDIRADQMVH